MQSAIRPSSRLWLALLAALCAPSGVHAEPPPKALPCMAGAPLQNRYTPVQLYLTVDVCGRQRPFYDIAAKMFVLGSLYGYYDTLRVKDESAHQAITAMKMSVTPRFTDDFRAHLQSMTSGPKLAELCRSMRQIGPPTYYPSYMVAHGLQSIEHRLQGEDDEDDALDHSHTPQEMWAYVLDAYLHCPQ